MCFGGLKASWKTLTLEELKITLGKLARVSLVLGGLKIVQVGMFSAREALSFFHHIERILTSNIVGNSVLVNFRQGSRDRELSTTNGHDPALHCMD